MYDNKVSLIRHLKELIFLKYVYEDGGGGGDEGQERGGTFNI